MVITHLIWDSEFFGLKIGKLEIFDETEFDIVNFRKLAEDQNFDLIYLFKFGNMFSSSLLTSSDICLMDIMVTMSMKFDTAKYKNHNFELKNKLNNQELLECYEIAEQTSKVSRFYNEPLIGKAKTISLYKKWVDNSINSKYCDGVLLEKKDNTVVGFYLIKSDSKNNVGCCSLIGVNQNLKSKGYGSKLWSQSFGYLSHLNIDTCVVPFSLSNTSSFNFHLKIGFNHVQEIKYIYHYRKTV